MIGVAETSHSESELEGKPSFPCVKSLLKLISVHILDLVLPRETLQRSFIQLLLFILSLENKGKLSAK